MQYGGQYSGANLTGQTVYDVADADGCIENVTVSYEYDWRGYPMKFTDANGNITLYEYDAIGRVIKTIFPDGTAETISYNFGGREITKTNALGTGFIYYYDGSGNLEEESINEWSKEIKEYQYDGFNNCIKEIFRSDSDNGKTHKYTYDTLQRPLSKEVYDNAGELIYKETYAYDITSGYTKETKIIAGGENTPSVITGVYYDANGNMLRRYTGLSAPVIINGLDDVTFGNDTEYAVTKYEYDEFDRLLTSTDALGQTESNTYDYYSGNLKTSTDRNGQNFNYTYDGLNNLKTKSLSDGTNIETKTYGMTGKITSAQNAAATINYTYNDKGLPISETDTAAGTVKSFTYDSDGNRLTFMLTRNGQTEISQSYAYDKLNRLISVSENGNVIAQYSYDNKGNRTQTVSGGETTNYTYNIANLLTSQTTGDKLNEQYTYYLNGNQKTKTSNGTLTTYEYDGMNRLSKENDTEYSFDDFGNRKTMTSDSSTVSYTYDLNNRLTKSVEKTGNETRTTTMFYDKNGNQISKAVITNKPLGENVTGDYIVSQNSDKNVALYEYNCYNQLVGVHSNGKISSYTYAPDGMRASKTADGNTINFVYDNANIVEEITADEVNKYFRGLEIIKNDGETYYFYNGQGDVSMLADNAGNTAASYIFDAYGNQSEENTVYNPFGYRGEYTDAESGLVYLRARMYDSETGRFMSEDPAKAEFNWYVYCHNNPIKYIDPTGLDVYYFVNTEFKKEADKDQKKLANLYDEPVHVLETDSRESFIEEWNKMGSWDGEDVNVSLVVINMHGSPGSISPHPSGDTGSIRTADMENGTLIPKYIDNILCLGCNSGHFDHRYSSLMNKMLVKNVVKSVIASDGTVTSRSVFGNYKSKGDKTFVSYLWSGKKYRDNMGFVKYTKNDIGELEWEVLGKKINSKSIFNSLGR